MKALGATSSPQKIYRLVDAQSALGCTLPSLSRRPSSKSFIFSLTADYHTGWNGLFPFAWRPKPGPHPVGKRHFSESIASLQAGRPFVAPVLQMLIFDREPAAVLEFADKVSKWDFKRVAPAHLKRDVACTPVQFRKAFEFLEDRRGDHPCNLEVQP